MFKHEATHSLARAISLKVGSAHLFPIKKIPKARFKEQLTLPLIAIILAFKSKVHFILYLNCLDCKGMMWDRFGCSSF